MKHYIGLDAHSSTCTFVSLNFSGKQLAKAVLPTNQKSLVDFIRSLKGEKSLTFEESTQSKWLHTIFHKEVNELIVCQPAYLPKKRAAKGDYQDALQLANALRGGHLEPVFHDEDNMFIPLRALTSTYRDIIADIRKSKSRLKAIFRGQGVKTPGKTIYTQPERIEELSKDWDKIAADALFYQIQTLEEIKSRFVKEFKENMKKYKILKLIDSVPGIDAIRANIITAYICDGARFKNKHKLWVYSGLMRRKQISDGKVYGKDFNIGRPELKEAFMGAATSVLISNNSLRKYYDRLRSNGVDDKKAKKQVARKIAAIVLSIMKTNKAYDDKYEEKKIELNGKN